MAGTIAADTLTHSTAGSLTTDYVVNGSAKAWADFSLSGSHSISASLNFSSITDNGTGKTTLALGSNMSSANYAGSGSTFKASTGTAYSTSVTLGDAKSSSSIPLFIMYTNYFMDPASNNHFIVQGDLA